MQLVAGVAWVGFLAVSVYALVDVGYWGVFSTLLRDSGGWQVGFDLVVACSIASAWVWRDARERGRSPWPWLALVPLAGSIPLLTWVVVRDLLPAARPTDPPAR